MEAVKKARNTIISVMAAVTAAAGIAVSCGMPGKSSDERKAATPEETLELFYENLLSGKWDDAEALCDSTMLGYVHRFRNAWTGKSGQDSSAMAIVPAIMSEAAIEVKDKDKTDDGAVRIYYRLNFRDRNLKERTAEMERRDGKWSIRNITTGQDEEGKNLPANS